jgi:hypothetical protein
MGIESGRGLAPIEELFNLLPPVQKLSDEFDPWYSGAVLFGRSLAAIWR